MAVTGVIKDEQGNILHAESSAKVIKRGTDSTVDADLTALEARVGTVDADLTALETKVGTVDADLTALEAKVDALDTDFTAGPGISETEYTLTEALPAGSLFTVPSYPVGAHRIQLWLDGAYAPAGAAGAWQEYGEAGASSTTILLNDALDAQTVLTVRITV